MSNITKDILAIIGTKFNEKAMLMEEKAAVSAEEVKAGKWAVHGNIYYGCDNVAEKLATGVYRAGTSMNGVFLVKQNILTDELIRLPDAASDKVLHHIEEFWALKEKFTAAGYLHKRGILLWGPQGSGKTAAVMQTIKQVTELGGVALIGDYPPEDRAAIRLLRSVEPDRPIVVVYEDVDELVYRYGDRTLTEVLDGEANVDNVLFIATTNYPERLPARLLNRPSRFDVVELIGLPNENARVTFLKAKTKLTPSEIRAWAKATDGLSIAHLKELIILVTIYGQTLDGAVDRLKNMAKLPHSSYVDTSKGMTYNIEVKLDQQTMPAPIVNIPAFNIPQPTINVTVPQQRKTVTTVKRDERGLITEKTDTPVEDDNIVDNGE